MKQELSISRQCILALMAGSLWVWCVDYAHSQVTELVLTDPLVRQIQIGPPPVGAVTGLNISTGVGVVAIPGIGVRQAKLVGVPVAWAGHRVIDAVDVATGLEFPAVLPDPPQLVPATVVKASGDAILVRRQLQGATVTEAVPVGSVFATRRGGLAPATRVTGALNRGGRVYIPLDRNSWARVIVRSSR
jgi:hypothetical protein